MTMPSGSASPCGWVSRPSIASFDVPAGTATPRHLYLSLEQTSKAQSRSAFRVEYHTVSRPHPASIQLCVTSLLGTFAGFMPVCLGREVDLKGIPGTLARGLQAQRCYQKKQLRQTCYLVLDKHMSEDITPVVCLLATSDDSAADLE
jgi:hypothetical protein